MARRIQLSARTDPELYKQLLGLHAMVADAMTRLSEAQDVPDEVYEQATGAFTDDQYRAVAWAITVINAFNRLRVTSRKPLPGQA